MNSHKSLVTFLTSRTNTLLTMKLVMFYAEKMTSGRSATPGVLPAGFRPLGVSMGWFMQCAIYIYKCILCNLRHARQALSPQ